MTRASWTVLVETKQADGTTERIELAALERDVSSPLPNDLGLRLAKAKDLLLRLQSFFVQDQVPQMSAVGDKRVSSSTRTWTAAKAIAEGRRL